MNSQLDLDPIDHLLTTTRAVRRRLDLTRPVERAVIVECLRLAAQAPSGANAQRWRWMVVTDPDKKQAIGHLYAPVRAVHHAEDGGLAARRPRQRPHDRLGQLPSLSTWAKCRCW
jgi:nitroreductase